MNTLLATIVAGAVASAALTAHAASTEPMVDTNPLTLARMAKEKARMQELRALMDAQFEHQSSAHSAGAMPCGTIEIGSVNTGGKNTAPNKDVTVIITGDVINVPNCAR